MLAHCERLGDPAGEVRYWRKAAIQPKTLLEFCLGGAMHAVGAPISPQSRKKQRGELSPGAYRRRIDLPQASKNWSNCLRAPSSFQTPSHFDDFNELGGRRMVAGIGHDL